MCGNAVVTYSYCTGYQVTVSRTEVFVLWLFDSIIAVSYEARACGVTRQMRGEDAKTKCPEIHLFQVPVVRDKADLTRLVTDCCTPFILNCIHVAVQM